MTPQELLTKAAEDVATHGHWKGTFSQSGVPDNIAPACIYGALTRAATGTTTCYDTADLVVWTVNPLIQQAADLLAKSIGRDRDTWYTVTQFNDADSTTAEDVILAMKRAAH